MTMPPLVTQAELEGLLRRLSALERRVARTEVVEKPLYAIGTWTPAFTGSGTAGTFTYDTTNTGGSYTRLGSRVQIDGRLRITAITVAPTNELRITGLPFAGTAAGNGIAGFGWMTLNTGITLTAGKTWLAIRVPASQSYFQIVENGSGVAAALIQGAALALIAGAADFQFSGQYRI